MNRGKLAVLSMLLLAVALAGFALWWNVASGRRTLEFWGQEGGARIIAPKAEVELLWLEPAASDAPSEQLSIGGRSYVVVRKGEITGARGLVHARHSRREDASFQWDAAVKSGGDYAVAVRFTEAGGATTIAFDFLERQIAHVESGREAKAADKIVSGWKTFAQRHAPAEADNSR